MWPCMSHTLVVLGWLACHLGSFTGLCEKASGHRCRAEASSTGYMAQLLGVLPLLLPAFPGVQFKTRLVPGEPFGAFCNSQL